MPLSDAEAKSRLMSHERLHQQHGESESRQVEQVIPAVLGTSMQCLKALPACFAALSVAMPVPKQAAHTPVLHLLNAQVLHILHMCPDLCTRVTRT